MMALAQDAPWKKTVVLKPRAKPTSKPNKQEQLFFFCWRGWWGDFWSKNSACSDEGRTVGWGQRSDIQPGKDTLDETWTALRAIKDQRNNKLFLGTVNQSDALTNRLRRLGTQEACHQCKEKETWPSSLLLSGLSSHLRERGYGWQGGSATAQLPDQGGRVKYLIINCQREEQLACRKG